MIRTRSLIVAATALLAAAAAGFAVVQPLTVGRWIGVAPPLVVAQEAHGGATRPDTPRFDHSAFDALLRKHVDADGWIDYAGFARDAKQLDAYLATIAAAPFDTLDRDGRLALLINAYNAYTIRLILDHWDGGKLKSIRDIDEPWDQKRWTVAGVTYSLNEIEHEQIRPKFDEPRIHFAVVCAAVGCPKLRNEAFVPERLDAQLEDQTTYTHTHDRWYRRDAGTPGEVWLTKLYEWYGGDFEQDGGTVLDYVAKYRPEIAGKSLRTRWLEYDWSLNDKRNRPGG